MGVQCGEIPRNVAGAAHECGHCCFGCPSGEKRDITGTFLADAAAAGAHIFTGIVELWSKYLSLQHIVIEGYNCFFCAMHYH